jgi:Fe-S cluster biogenesis protein NfuA
MGTTSPYIIYSESTPNPDVMKFVSNKILTDKSIEYLKIEDTENNTLIRKIFSLPFIKEIFISKNYISVKKHNNIDWIDVTNQLRILIQESLNKGVIIIGQKKKIKVKKTKKSNSILLKKIDEILDEFIRPGIHMDGGDIELIECTGGVLKVFLKGACSGCPSSQMTLKNGIEAILNDKIPNEVKEVVAINY